MKKHRPQKCKHAAPPAMAYIDFHQDAIARTRRGEKQTYCPICLKHVWGEFWLKQSK